MKQLYVQNYVGLLQSVYEAICYQSTVKVYWSRIDRS